MKERNREKENENLFCFFFSLPPFSPPPTSTKKKNFFLSQETSPLCPLAASPSSTPLRAP